jgi:hypothetical protein
MTCLFLVAVFGGPLKKNDHKKNSKIFTKGVLNKSQKVFEEVTKSLLKESQKAVFTDKSCIKVLQKASQNTRHKIVTTG